MKKTALASIIIIVTIMFLISISFSIKNVEAATDTYYRIERVDHTIQIMYNGYFFINDTIHIVGNASEGAEPLARFTIGFPVKFGSYVLRCVAWDASGVFNVTLDVPLENRMGFYAVEINFPQPLDVSNGITHDFTVGFILSNNLVQPSDTNKYVLDFPAYPSLTGPVTNCSATVLFPGDVTEVIIAKDDGIVSGSAYNTTDLPAFTYAPANVTFTLASDRLRLFDIQDLEREIVINGIGEVEGSDSYYITSEEPQTIVAIEIVLPPNASGVRAYDQFGRKFENNPTLVGNEETSRYRIAFTLPLESNKSTRFTVKYSLPSQYIASQEGSNNFRATFPLFPHVDYYIEQASVTLVLPEGARILSPESTLIDDGYAITRSVFQETLTINRQGISVLEEVFSSENILQITYDYNPLWLSFRPTLWIWTLATIGCAVVVVWKRLKAPAVVAVPEMVVKLRPEYLKSFVDSYEEKRKIGLEVESIETMVRKGKIPRRRYKVRRKTLETRLNTLSRSLADFKEKMRATGGKYADLMRQLEIAETEINEVEANIRSIEARHSRGEISLEAYRKLLTDYLHRKEAANTAISGILLRLREELR